MGGTVITSGVPIAGAAVSAFEYFPAAARAAVLAGTQTADVKSYLDDALADVDVVFLPRGTYPLSDTLSIPDGKTLYGDPGNAATLQLMLSSSSGVVVEMGDASRISGVTIDGNLDARETEGTLTDYVFGVHFEDVSNAVAEDIVYKDVGSTDDHFDNEGADGGGFLMEITTSATADMMGNRIQRAGGNVPKAGFHARVKSPFLSTGFDVNPYFITGNRVEGIVGYGCRKNAIEVLGPNTRGNTIADCTVIDNTGQGGIEADYGAHLNQFINCKVFFSPTFQLTRSHDCFSQRRSNSVDGTRSYGNVFVDCQVQFLGEIQGTSNLSGFVEAGMSADAQFIRPVMYGPKLNARFNKAVGATGIVSGYYQQATLGKNMNTLISGARFYNVDRGIKIFSSSGADLVVVRDSHIYSRGAWFENSGSGTVDRVHFTGNSYLQATGASGEAGSGTTTALDYGDDVRTQTSATSPIA